MCVNLKKVNAATVRDHYPLPIIEHVLERVAGKKAYSFLDGFLGYNQVSIKVEDQHKTAFATEWGIYAYRVMPFGLTNAPATFQRLMSHAFREYLHKFLEIFMDDLCVHSGDRGEHIDHLRKVFEKCRVYRICLNPDKCKFMVRQGKFWVILYLPMVYPRMRIKSRSLWICHDRFMLREFRYSWDIAATTVDSSTCMPRWQDLYILS